jgi:Ribonuclease HIII
LNRLLAWGHAKALETLLDRVSCGRAIADQFGDERLILDALQGKGRTIILEQRHKAESDLAVAAASILARAEFLLRLKRLSEEIGTTLPKGASPAVELAGRMIVKKHGEGRLDQSRNCISEQPRLFWERQKRQTRPTRQSQGPTSSRVRGQLCFRQEFVRPSTASDGNTDRCGDLARVSLLQSAAEEAEGGIRNRSPL